MKVTQRWQNPLFCLVALQSTLCLDSAEVSSSVCCVCLHVSLSVPFHLLIASLPFAPFHSFLILFSATFTVHHAAFKSLTTALEWHSSLSAACTVRTSHFLSGLLVLFCILRCVSPRGYALSPPIEFVSGLVFAELEEIRCCWARDAVPANCLVKSEFSLSDECPTLHYACPYIGKKNKTAQNQHTDSFKPQ